MSESINQSPESPIHRKVFCINDAKAKLQRITNGIPLDDLPLDYINTTSFGDLYLLDRILGAGAFGVVLQIIERQTAKEYAIKVK